MLFLHQFVLALLAAADVEAGSRAWEPPIHHAKAAIIARDLSDINNIYVNKSNVSSDYHGHHKRLFGINNPANTGAYPRLWPNGNINACFEQRTHAYRGENNHTREILYNDLITARELWRSAGLDDNNGRFRFTILADDDPRCERSQRSSHLFIMYAGEGVRRLSTSVGVDQPRAAPGSDRPDLELGPAMILSDVVDMGMGNVVANYAHEMGHAWGLHHEHQNPKWWDFTFTGVERRRFFFNETNFLCENLADFDRAMERFADLPEWERRAQRNRLCRDRGEASRGHFAGGFNYIPVTDEPATIDDERNEPDWESIMIYPSNAGGRTVNGVKLNVLTRANGAPILPNSRPSRRDVQGLKRMYGIKTSLIGRFLGERNNPFKNMFDRIRRTDQDAGCS